MIKKDENSAFPPTTNVEDITASKNPQYCVLNVLSSEGVRISAINILYPAYTK